MKEQRVFFCLFFTLGCLCVMMENALLGHMENNMFIVNIIEKQNYNTALLFFSLTLLLAFCVQMQPFVWFAFGVAGMRVFLQKGVSGIFFILFCIVPFYLIYSFFLKIKEKI